MQKRVAISLLFVLIGLLTAYKTTCAANIHPYAFTIDDSEVKITMPACHKLTGSVTGLKIINPDNKQFTYSWKNSVNVEVANTLDLNNKSDGSYTLTVTATDGSGTQTYGPVEFISTESTKINTANVQITPSICGAATGGVKGLTATGLGALRYSWVDVHNVEVGTQPDISGLPVGIYTLNVVSEDGFCGASYGPIAIPNSGGPVIDVSKLKYFGTDCQDKGGSLTGIKVSGGTGSYTYEWLNNTDIKVSDQLDLVEVRSGLYRLVVHDEGSCGPSLTIPYNVVFNSNGISYEIDDSKTHPTTCNELGSVTGLEGGSSLLYTWFDDELNIVSETSQLLNARGGMYKVVITSNCLDPAQRTESTEYFNLGPKRVTLPEFTSVIKGTCANFASGSIKVTGNDQIVAYKWYNANNQLVGSNNELKDMPGGTYTLVLIDTMGCEKPYRSYAIPSSTGAQIGLNSGTISNDECNTSIGSITGITINGGIAPYTYKWFKEDGSIAGEGPELLKVSAGTYMLAVSDASGCNPAYQGYTILNQDFLSAPELSGQIKLCFPTPVSFSVKNPKANSTYRLYDSSTATIPIYEQATGSFTITPTESKTYYVSRAGGACESEKTVINVTVAIGSVAIPNGFSPNNDGINDTWALKGFEGNSSVLIKVFTRDGRQVFNSLGYAKPFNGIYNGNLLPAGTYYYIIDLRGECKSISGSITIIR